MIKLGTGTLAMHKCDKTVYRYKQEVILLRHQSLALIPTIASASATSFSRCLFAATSRGCFPYGLGFMLLDEGFII